MPLDDYVDERTTSRLGTVRVPCSAVPGDGRKEHLGGNPPDLGQVHVDGRERRLGRLGHYGPVVEAHEGDVVRHPRPDFPERLRHPPGDLVAAAENGVGVRRGSQKYAGRLATPDLAPLAVERLSAGQRQPGAGERLARRPPPEAGGPEDAGPVMWPMRLRPVASRCWTASIPPPSSSGRTEASFGSADSLIA